MNEFVRARPNELRIRLVGLKSFLSRCKDAVKRLSIEREIQQTENQLKKAEFLSEFQDFKESCIEK